MNVLFEIILANTIISLISLVGVITILSKWFSTKKCINWSVSFAAGVMLSAAMLNILPEALEKGDPETIMGVALIGMVVSFFMERVVLWYHHHHEESHNISPSAYLIIIGDGIHNFIDGVAIAATYIVNPALGLTATIAIAAHEIPQEFADFSILLHSGISRKKAILYNFISALVAVVGGILGYYFISQFAALEAYALAFSAGVFIYVAAADLIPELHADDMGATSLRQSIPFLLGVLLMFVISQTIVHGHPESDVHDDTTIEHMEDEDIFDPLH